uniref:Uncharacterized protein n=1 Tax=Romanomermis culicivorax TaxID=13658 RepID=A0A915KU48_ROMCU
MYKDVGLSMIIKDLLPQVLYEYRARLTLDSGLESSWSAMQFFKTEKDAPKEGNEWGVLV